jgi:hypothetical protein
MIYSISNLQKSIEKYNESQKARENFTCNAVNKATTCFKDVFDLIMVVVSTIFCILELLAVYYAIVIAVKCTVQGPERIVHIVLAICMPLPYLLLNMLFNKCATDTLRGANLLVTSAWDKNMFGSSKSKLCMM